MKAFILALLAGAFVTYALTGIVSSALAQETATMLPPIETSFAKPPAPLAPVTPLPSGKQGGLVDEARVRQIVRDELRKQFSAVRYPVLPDVRGKR